MTPASPNPRPDATGPRRPDATGPKRLDASMTLLTEMMDRPLDPAYAAAAQRRVAAGSPGRRSWNTPGAFAAAVCAGLLMAASALTYGTPAPGRVETRARLVERIGERERALAERTEQAAALRADIAALRGDGNGAGASRDPAGSLPRLEALGGATVVAGPGLVVTLDDAPTVGDAAAGGPREDDTVDHGRILAKDVANVVNALWASGAEGIAVNGIRLTSTSSIRLAGRAVLVGFRPLARPYVVETIGGPAALSAFEQGAGGAYLAELRSAYSAQAQVRPAGRVELPAAGSLTLRHARIAPRPGPTATPRPFAPSETPAGQLTGAPVPPAPDPDASPQEGRP